ncbi:hypothetical protein FACS189435_4760 [Bacteroidia bacterium]|nr:hypothetical protein FACS189435_4760 [Bacteroidia bacterium]
MQVIAGFGNGLILVSKDEAFLFDTPATGSQTETLVKWIADSLKATVSTFVPNHWHEDCLGGLDYLHSKGVKSYANQMTVDLAKDIHSKGLGNLSDAQPEEWAKTIQKVIGTFSEAKIVIPGHGGIGGKELLQHTKELLKK